jgi:gamma-glutamyl hercynylcysteine S-oxide synthase
VPSFEIDQYEVTNRQYLEFMAAGGYETRAFWSDDDWNWKTARAISHPVFWTRAGPGRATHGSTARCSSEIALPLDWPVYVSHAEAMAYARWAGKSLPTEEEWHRAAYGRRWTERKYPWGIDGAPQFQFRQLRLRPLESHAGECVSLGPQRFWGGGSVRQCMGVDVHGVRAVSGFEAFPFYRGYSADFFDGKHFVMKGGSPRTAACMLRRAFRNWFQGHYQYVYAGFRCVKR